MKVMEYMAFEMPLVAFDVDATAASLRHRSSGFLHERHMQA
jgi:hypothetical protein